MVEQLSARERIIVAIDTSREADAERLASVAQEAGARSVKLGLELSSATSWQYCADLAAAHELDWVADAKLHDIPTTVRGAVTNIIALDHSPFGITMHTLAGAEAMRVAQETAGVVKMLGVTVLTSSDDAETKHIYNGLTRAEKVPQLAQDAADAGIAGLVCSPREVGAVRAMPATEHLFTMIPGTRSAAAEHHDQVNVGTPAAAIRDGADLLVIGRQITKAEDPARAYEDLVAEIEAAL